MNSNFKSARNLNEANETKRASRVSRMKIDAPPKLVASDITRSHSFPFSISMSERETFPALHALSPPHRNAVLSVTNNSLTNSPSLPRPTASIHPNKKENKAIKTFLFGSRFPQLDGSMALG